MVVTSKMNSASLPPTRPDSEQLVDLHVYCVPLDAWNNKYQSAYNEVINETISLGFVRVWPELSIWNLREELRNQIGPASLPKEYVYVRSVGRCLTQVKGRQELELKVKAFLPPKNFAPEIFIMEGVQDVPDTALIEESKEVAVSTMEVDEEESMEEKGLTSRKAKKIASRGTANSNLTVKSKFPSRNSEGSKAVASVKSNGRPLALKSNTAKTKGSERSQTGQTMTMNELKALQKRETELKKPRSNKMTLRVGKKPTVKGPAVGKNVTAGTSLKGKEMSDIRQEKVEETLTDSVPSRGHQKARRPSINLKPKQNETKKGGPRGHVTFTHVKGGKDPYQHKPGHRPIFPKEYGRDNISAQYSPRTISHKAQVAQPSYQNPSLSLLQPSSNQPPVALHSPSPHPLPPRNAHAHPVHPQVSTPVALPQSTMPHTKPSSRNYVSPRRQPSHSRMLDYSSSNSLKRREIDTSSKRRVVSRKESENSLLSSHEPQSSRPTYSQTTEETLPGFSSMSGSQQSETSPPHNSVLLPAKQSGVRESTPLRENRGKHFSGSSSLSNSFHMHSSNHHHDSHTNNESVYPENPINSSDSNLINSRNFSNQDEPQREAHVNPVINPPELKTPFTNSPALTSHQRVDDKSEDFNHALPALPVVSSHAHTHPVPIHSSDSNRINSHNYPDQEEPHELQHVNPPANLPDVYPSELKSPFTNSAALTNHLRPDNKSDDINHALPILPVLSSHAPTHPVSSDSERGPQLTTPSANRGLSKLQSPRKEARQDTFTKNTNSDSGLGEQTPEETQERILRGGEGSQVFERNGDSFRQDHQISQYETSRSRPFAAADEGQRYHDFYQGDSPRSYQQNQNFPSRNHREEWGKQPHPVHEDQRDYYGERGPQGGQSAIHPVHGTYEDLSPRGGSYQQRNRPVESLSNQEKLFTPRTHRDEGMIQDSSYNPHFSGGTTSRYSDDMRNQQGHPYNYDNSREPTDHASDTQEAMAFLQLSNEGTGLRDKQEQRYGSPSDLAAGKPINPEKQRLLNQIQEEQQGRLEMEKMREELIKKAKNLQGKTIDRRKKARDYWKKRYYDEKKKTPSLEEQVAKLANQVQQQNRKLLHHLEGKGAKAPKGPPSKRMDHKIQIFKHQHDMEDLKRQVDNARMKLATEIKLRTQAETELRVLKSEVIQKKINVTLKRGKQLQAIQKTEEKGQGRTPLPKGVGGAST